MNDQPDDITAQGTPQDGEPPHREPMRRPGSGDGTAEGDAEYERLVEDDAAASPTAGDPGAGDLAPRFTEPPS